MRQHVGQDDDATPVGAETGGLLRRVRSGLDRLAESLTRRLRPVLDGFQEHAWTGRLYLIVTGLGLAGTLASWLPMVMFFIVAEGATGAAAAIFVTLAIVPFALFQWFLLRDVARFRPWARWGAIVVTLGGIASGLALLMAGQPVVRRIAGLSELALSLQFCLYFVRSGQRFKEVEQPAAPSSLDPATRLPGANEPTDGAGFSPARTATEQLPDGLDRKRQP